VARGRTLLKELFLTHLSLFLSDCFQSSTSDSLAVAQLGLNEKRKRRKTNSLQDTQTVPSESQGMNSNFKSELGWGFGETVSDQLLYLLSFRINWSSCKLSPAAWPLGFHLERNLHGEEGAVWLSCPPVSPELAHRRHSVHTGWMNILPESGTVLGTHKASLSKTTAHRSPEQEGLPL
jgi:hypothetical protein